MKKYSLEVTFQPEYTHAELVGLVFTIDDELQKSIDKAQDFVNQSPEINGVEVICHPPDNWNDKEHEYNPKIGLSCLKVYTHGIYLYLQESWDSHRQYEFTLTEVS